MILIDEEIRLVIPPLSKDERSQLEANILNEGCREPLVVWSQNGSSPVLLDGHNRFDICEAHGIEFKTREMEFPDRTAAMVWMIDNQKGRRNVSDYDKGLLAMKKQELLGDAARKNLTTPTGGTTLAKLPKSQPKVNAREDAAKEAGLSGRTLDAVKLIKDAHEKGEVPDEVINDLRNRKVAVHRVAKDIKEHRSKSERLRKRNESLGDHPIIESVIVGDFREKASEVKDGSVSLIFTDPPYDKKASKLLPDLGKFAEAKLMEGGSLILYVGQTQIPEAVDALRQSLRYWWTIACIHSGNSTIMREYGIKAGWKAMLWFVKKTRHDNSQIVADVVSGGQEKSHHDWQQSELEARYWIEALTNIGDLVCDPFLGGGTTGVAATSTARMFVGIEINESTAKIASKRISDGH